MKLISAFLVATIALAGCSHEGPSTNDGASPGMPAAPALDATRQAKVDKAVAVARAIERDPAGADRILQENGLTEQQLDDLLYAIAADPAMSAAYTSRLGP